MLSLLIPGPQQPGNSIDVYLEPLIEDLNHLWSSGELVYDAYTRSTFTLKAMLLWTSVISRLMGILQLQSEGKNGVSFM